MSKKGMSKGLVASETDWAPTSNATRCIPLTIAYGAKAKIVRMLRLTKAPLLVRTRDHFVKRVEQQYEPG
jgi:hypothetical protein